ncbi:MAG: hypothetical protein QOD06_2792, partial [Candidatus Binatota bacterium]|nr:hypothetical protein [Candidatus Binatota bacterium]
MARPLALSGQRRELAFAALFLVVWIGAPFWRIATLRAVNIQDDIYASDLWNDRLPARAFVGRTIARGELPLWTPGIYTGFPALADVEFGALYPSNLLLFGSLPPYVAFAYAQLLPLFLAGLGVHLLARRLGIGRGGSLLASGAFALSGFFVCHLRQLNMIDAACWIPFVLLGVEKLLATPRAPALAMLALVWAVQCLAGHPQISYFTALALVPYTVARWRIVRAGETGRGLGLLDWVRVFVTDRSVLAVVLGVALGTVIAAIQLLPGLELAALSHRRGGFPYEQAAAFPAAAGSALTFLIPYWNGDPATDTFRGSGLFWEQ